MAEQRRPVLVLAWSDLGRDPRVRRQLDCLRASYPVIAAGLGDPQMEGVEFVRLDPRAKTLAGRVVGALRLVSHSYEAYYWSTAAVRDCLQRLSARRPLLVLANDIDTLPAALRIADRAPVIFDAHEYAPLEFEDRPWFRWVVRPYRFHLCRTYVPQVTAMTTVGSRIAQEYERETGVRPTVIWNAADAAELVPSPVDRRVVRLVHHGGAQRSRRLEGMIRVVQHLDRRFELHLFLVAADLRYARSLRALAAGDPRIRFHDPVPLARLPSTLNRFDVGLFLLPPTNFNYRFALPNKLFEFVQARLAVAIGPSPEMARLVEHHGFGIVSPDFEPGSLARALADLTPQRIVELKLRAHDAARALSAESARASLLELVGRAIGPGA